MKRARWTREETERFVQMYEAGTLYKLMAHIFERSVGALYMQRRELGLAPRKKVEVHRYPHNLSAEDLDRVSRLTYKTILEAQRERIDLLSIHAILRHVPSEIIARFCWRAEQECTECEDG